MLSLSEKNALALGVADEESIAWSCAKAFPWRRRRARYHLSQRSRRTQVRAGAETLDAPIEAAELGGRVLELPPLRIPVEQVEPSAANQPFIQLVAREA